MFLSTCNTEFWTTHLLQKRFTGTDEETWNSGVSLISGVGKIVSENSVFLLITDRVSPSQLASLETN